MISGAPNDLTAHHPKLDDLGLTSTCCQDPGAMQKALALDRTPPDDFVTFTELLRWIGKTRPPLERA